MILPQRVLSSLPTSNWVLLVQTQAPGKHSVLHSPLELRNKWSECVIVHDWQQNSLWCISVNSTCVSILAVINNKRHGRRNQSNWMICMWTIRYFAVLVEMNAFIQQQQKKKAFGAFVIQPQLLFHVSPGRYCRLGLTSANYHRAGRWVLMLGNLLWVL